MSKNLDLNTTARKNLEKQHLNTTYLDNVTISKLECIHFNPTEIIYRYRIFQNRRTKKTRNTLALKRFT